MTDEQPTITIRDVGDGDLDDIAAMNNAAVPAVNALTRVDLEHFVEIAHTFVVAGDRAGFLIGLGPGVDYDSPNYRWFSSRYDDFGYVDRVVVDPDTRSRGLGRALYDAFADRVRADGQGHLLAEVNIRPRNGRSLRFHERYGFSPVGEQDTEGGAKRVVLLERTLDG